ncbi:MAG: PRC-barrel domain-containing protein [Cyanobacteria bacterium]|nr:PRC-barrel domain-containing protein [Cyanobacteriota bacterium]
MPAEFRQRADFLGTQVITRDTGRKLGVVSQLWVDVDRQEVVALSLRQNLFYGTPQPMMLDSIRQIGDVILVDDENVIEDVDVERYTSLINCEVITETGELLGKVRGYKFDIDSGKLETLAVASLGFPLIPDQVVSTFELAMSEVVSSGPDRLIVYEGAEERLVQITVGFLERVGLGKASWERKNEYAPPAPIRTENQLPSGQQTPLETPPIRQPQRVSEPIAETWDEDNWEPVEVRQSQPPQKARLYVEDEPEDNWSTASSNSPRSPYEQPKDDYDDENYDNVELADVVDTINSQAIQRSASVVSAVEVTEVSEELSASDADPWAEPNAELSSEVAIEAPVPDNAAPNDYRPVLNIPEKIKEPQE